MFKKLSPENKAIMKIVAVRVIAPLAIIVTAEVIANKLANKIPSED